MAKQCETQNCEDKPVCAGLCGACYQWHWNRKNAGVAAGQKYRKRMKRIQNRIEALPSPPKRTATVSSAKTVVRRRSNGEARAYH